MIRLNSVWKFAMTPLSAMEFQSPLKAPALRRISITSMKRMVPAQLKTMWTTPVRFASLEEPMEQTIAVVTQVPRLMPMIMG